MAALGDIAAAVSAVGPVIVTVIEVDVAVSLLDHREVLEFFSEPMDPKGETLHALSVF
jgi:hypothetical protein